MRPHFSIWFFASILLFSACSTKNAEKSITVFAAAGVRLPTEDICQQYEKQTGNKTIRNYASSGILARQIESGAEADVFISANRQWVDFLSQKGFVADSAIHKLAGNKLVLIAPADWTGSTPEFTPEYDIVSAVKTKFCIGDPEYVPVGKYAKKVLDSLTWYEQLNENMIKAKDVSAVLHYVGMGECDFGIVYLTEAQLSDKVKIVAEIPQDLYVPIEFYVVPIKQASGADLVKFFMNDSSKNVLKSYGFEI